MGQPLFSKINELILRIFKEATDGGFKKKKLYKFEANSSSKKQLWFVTALVHDFAPLVSLLELMISVFSSRQS